MDEKRLQEIERIVNEAYSPGPWDEVAELVAEVRRLRAEHDQLQAALNDANAYAVELHAQARVLLGPHPRNP